MNEEVGNVSFSFEVLTFVSKKHGCVTDPFRKLLVEAGRILEVVMVVQCLMDFLMKRLSSQPRDTDWSEIRCNV